jgi:hypothetical protein
MRHSSNPSSWFSQLVIPVRCSSTAVIVSGGWLPGALYKAYALEHKERKVSRKELCNTILALTLSKETGSLVGSTLAEVLTVSLQRSLKQMSLSVG